MALREMIGLVACCLVLCELPQLAHSSGSGQVSSYRSGSSICRRRERRYVDSYKCLENTDSRICWLLVKQLDRSGCVQRESSQYSSSSSKKKKKKKKKQKKKKKKRRRRRRRRRRRK